VANEEENIELQSIQETLENQSAPNKPISIGARLPIEIDRHLDNGGNSGNHSTPTPCTNHMASLEAMLMQCSNWTRMPGRELQEMK